LFPDSEVSPLKIELKQSFSRLLFQILIEQYQRLGFSKLDDVYFTYLCIARIVEPTSKLDSLRVLSDLGIGDLSKDRLYRCLTGVVAKDYRTTISSICFEQALSQGLSLVLYDVTTLYFEIQEEDSYRKPGLSKERRLEPQIIIGLLVNQNGFPLGLQSFEGNTAETKTILPVIEAFRAKHHLDTITVVADAAMLSLKNLEALSQAGYHYIVGSRLSKVPYDVAQYQNTQSLTDNQIVVTEKDNYKIIYQYRTKRASLDIRNIEKQLTKARRIVNGQAPLKRNRFLSLKTRDKRLNQALIDKAYALAGIKGYVTDLELDPTKVITSYHQLFQVEASFRMAKSDLKARPIFHRKRDAIEAHLTIVLACLAVSRRIEQLTEISIKRFVRSLRPIRSGVVTINGKDYDAEAEVPKDIHKLLQKLHSGH
jgi:transposase